MTGPYLYLPAAVPLFRTERLCDATAARRSPVVATQFPAFLAADRPAAAE